MTKITQLFSINSVKIRCLS